MSWRISVNNALREYYEMKEEIRNPESSVETYCVSYKQYTTNEDTSIRETKQNRLMLLSNCAICGKTKWTFIKNQELSND